jgi:Ca2+-binding RTX toxin-like protein
MSTNLMRRKLFFEGLESRRVLAAGVVLSEGVLTVEGTRHNDWVFVSTVTDELGTHVSVQLNKTTHQFNLGGVTSHLEINTLGGNDRVFIGDDVSLLAIVFGGSGNDWLKGGGGRNEMFGGRGNDHILGGAGDDVLVGEHGNDKLFGLGGQDQLEGNDGNDHLSGGDGDDLLIGDAGHDKVRGGAGDDEIWGGTGHDQLAGEDGNDVLHGEDGKDHLAGGLGDDELFGEGGKDHVHGGDGNDWLDGGGDKDKLWGGLGDDSIKGGAGNDQLNGNEGNNLLDGDEGKDKLINGTEVDLDAPPPPPEPTWVEYTTYMQSEGGCFASLVYTFDGLEERLAVEVGSSFLFASLDIVIGGVLLGTVNVDEAGCGQVVFTSSPDEDGEAGFPAGFDLVDGAAVDVGPQLHGTLNLSQA